jgi:hypothetical protein
MVSPIFSSALTIGHDGVDARLVEGQSLPFFASERQPLDLGDQPVILRIDPPPPLGHAAGRHGLPALRLGPHPHNPERPPRDHRQILQRRLPALMDMPHRGENALSAPHLSPLGIDMR